LRLRLSYEEFKPISNWAQKGSPHSRGGCAVYRSPATRTRARSENTAELAAGVARFLMLHFKSVISFRASPVLCECSAMNQDKPIPISVTSLRAEDCSPDQNNLIISLTTKYSTVERKYSIPIECFYDLILDLQRLHISRQATPHEDAAPIQAPVQSELDLTPAE
jgi:hypothetical protein